MWCLLANGCVAVPVTVKKGKCFVDRNVSVNFGVNLPQRGIYPKPIFTKFGMGKVSQVRTLTPNFTILA